MSVFAFNAHLNLCYNLQGQVVVNRRVDSKSYTSLHALVHDMFPPTTLHEQVISRFKAVGR